MSGKRPNWWIVACLAVLCLILAQEARASDIPWKTLLLEAEGEGYVGMVAVGEVIRNRAKRGDLSHDAVCLAPWQFSAWNDRLWASNRLKRASKGAIETAKRAWRDSAGTNSTLGSRHYHTKAVKPYWSKGKAPIVTIGAHRFYNNVS